MLCKSNSKDIICPKLDGSLVGEDRIKYWDYLKQFISKDLLEDDLSKDEEN